MVETAWDIVEVKRLKKIQLAQGNLLMLLSFVLFVYLLLNEKAIVVFAIFCGLLWIFTATIFYTLKTGKTISTKTSRRVQEYDKYRLGKKRWKRRKIIEAVIISMCSVGFTVAFFVLDFNNVRIELINCIPFIGCWMGYNIGETVRISDL